MATIQPSFANAAEFFNSLLGIGQIVGGSKTGSFVIAGVLCSGTAGSWKPGNVCIASERRVRELFPLFKHLLENADCFVEDSVLDCEGEEKPDHAPVGACIQQQKPALERTLPH